MPPSFPPTLAVSLHFSIANHGLQVDSMYFHTTLTPLAPSSIHLSPTSLPFPIARLPFILSDISPPVRPLTSNLALLSN